MAPNEIAFWVGVGLIALGAIVWVIRPAGTGRFKISFLGFEVELDAPSIAIIAMGIVLILVSTQLPGPPIKPSWNIDGKDWVCDSDCVPTETTGKKRIISQDSENNLTFINPFVTAGTGTSRWTGSNTMQVDGFGPNKTVTIVSSKEVRFSDKAVWKR